MRNFFLSFFSAWYIHYSSICRSFILFIVNRFFSSKTLKLSSSIACGRLSLLQPMIEYSSPPANLLHWKVKLNEKIFRSNIFFFFLRISVYCAFFCVLLILFQFSVWAAVLVLLRFTIEYITLYISFFLSRWLFFFQRWFCTHNLNVYYIHRYTEQF